MARLRRPSRPAALIGAVILVVFTTAASVGLRGPALWASSANSSPDAPPQPLVSTASDLAGSPALNSTPEPVAHLVPLVPIVGFWSDETTISRRALAAALGGPGSSSPGQSVAVSLADREGLYSVFGFWPRAEAMSPAGVRSFVRATPGALGIVRAEDVTPDVRALAVDGIALFGIDRIRDLDDWPLLASEPGSPPSFLPAETWSLAAGGDVMAASPSTRSATWSSTGHMTNAARRASSPS